MKLLGLRKLLTIREISSFCAAFPLDSRSRANHYSPSRYGDVCKPILKPSWYTARNAQRMFRC